MRKKIIMSLVYNYFYYFNTILVNFICNSVPLPPSSGAHAPQMPRQMARKSTHPRVVKEEDSEESSVEESEEEVCLSL